MANNEYGDFQTNASLTERVVALVRDRSVTPATVVEPTCGEGNFVRSVLDAFPNAVVHGLEIQERYINQLEHRFQLSSKFVLHKANYFDFDWGSLFKRMAKPVWVIGNPPWVTNTQLVKLDSNNLPTKSPQAHLRGYEAQTGKSNFDISESMLRDWFRWCASCDGTLAVICKTSVARKVLQWWWKQETIAPRASVYNIDAKVEFGAAVAACVLVCSFDQYRRESTCDIYDSLEASEASTAFGLIDGHLISNARAYDRGRRLLGKTGAKWRSGIKHDAGSVLEFTDMGSHLVNKLGEEVQIEQEFVYPLLKGSDLSRSNVTLPHRAMLVPQRFIGDDTAKICEQAPRTWAYLKRHQARFDERKSSIYAKSGPFSVFGVGEYTFQPWKIAIGALYKKLDFRLVGPADGKPVVFDDTVYFLGFENKRDAQIALGKLQTPLMQEFLNSMIFWDDMRPVKTEILNRVDLSHSLVHEAA